MCPACVASAGLMAAGATSTGGLAAFVLKFFRKRQTQQRKGTENETGRGRNGSCIGS
jgi:hypothetical protein